MYDRSITHASTAPSLFCFDTDLPDGIHPIFISSATQQAMQICVDEDVTQESNTKMIEKETLLNDIQTHGQGSNFFEFQQQIQVPYGFQRTSRSNALMIFIAIRIIRRMKLLSSTITIISIRKTFVSQTVVSETIHETNLFTVICFDPKLKALIESVSNASSCRVTVAPSSITSHIR